MLKFIVKTLMLILSRPGVRCLLLDLAEHLAKKTQNPYDDELVKEIRKLADRATVFEGEK